MQQPEHPKLVFEYFVREADSVGHRTDWFLLFHAILLDAFMGSSGQHVAVGWFGALTSYLWLAIGVRQTWDMQHLSECLSEPRIMGGATAHVFSGIFTTRRTLQPPWMRWARSTPILCIVIPLALFGVWLALLWPVAQPKAALGAIACCALATILVAANRRFPRVPRAAVEDVVPPPGGD